MPSPLARYLPSPRTLAAALLLLAAATPACDRKPAASPPEAPTATATAHVEIPLLSEEQLTALREAQQRDEQPSDAP